MKRTTTIVFVRAVAVHTYGNGLAGIEIESEPLSAEDRSKIHELFPNTMDQVFDLLDKEALLAASHGIDAQFEGTRQTTHSTLPLTPQDVEDKR